MSPNQGRSCQSPPEKAQSVSGTVTTWVVAWAFARRRTSARAKTLDRSKGGLLVGETMLPVAGGSRAVHVQAGCWWMLDSHQPLERVVVQMLVGRLALAQRGLAQGPNRKGIGGSSWGVRPGAW